MNHTFSYQNMTKENLLAAFHVLLFAEPKQVLPSPVISITTPTSRREQGASLAFNSEILFGFRAIRFNTVCYTFLDSRQRKHRPIERNDGRIGCRDKIENSFTCCSETVHNSYWQTEICFSSVIPICCVFYVLYSPYIITPLTPLCYISASHILRY